MADPASPPARPGNARVAVLGAATLEGRKLREELARQRVPGGRVDLYGTLRGEALLGEYAGEARLIQEPDLEEVARHDVVFVCELSDTADRIVTMADRQAVVIDLTGKSVGREAMRLVHHGISPDPPKARGALLAPPHPIAALLAEILHPLQREVGVREALATVLRPAADFGEDGIDELREQTVRLLGFEKAPTQVFGRQLAFDVIPESLLAAREAGLERRIAREVRTLLGWKEDRLSVRLVCVPVFVGHAISLRLVPERSTDAAAVMRSTGLARPPGPRGRKSGGTPLSAPEERRTEVCEVVDDGLGGFWIWAIAGGAGSAAAEQAVRAAAAVCDL